MQCKTGIVLLRRCLFGVHDPTQRCCLSTGIWRCLVARHGGILCRNVSDQSRLETVVLPKADADGGAPSGATAAQQAAKDAGAEASQAEAEAEVDEIDDAAHVRPESAGNSRLQIQKVNKLIALSAEVSAVVHKCAKLECQT